jgi:hypothetical protein
MISFFVKGIRTFRIQDLPVTSLIVLYLQTDSNSNRIIT